jgi:hypothetical protein
MVLLIASPSRALLYLYYKSAERCIRRALQTRVAVLLRSPASLAYLLEVAGAIALERCGAILDRWITAETEDPE